MQELKILFDTKPINTPKTPSEIAAAPKHNPLVVQTYQDINDYLFFTFQVRAQRSFEPLGTPKDEFEIGRGASYWYFPAPNPYAEENIDLCVIDDAKNIKPELINRNAIILAGSGDQRTAYFVENNRLLTRKESVVTTPVDLSGCSRVVLLKNDEEFKFLVNVEPSTIYLTPDGTYMRARWKQGHCGIVGKKLEFNEINALLDGKQVVDMSHANRLRQIASLLGYPELSEEEKAHLQPQSEIKILNDNNFKEITTKVKQKLSFLPKLTTQAFKNYLKKLKYTSDENLQNKVLNIALQHRLGLEYDFGAAINSFLVSSTKVEKIPKKVDATLDKIPNSDDLRLTIVISNTEELTTFSFNAVLRTIIKKDGTLCVEELSLTIRSTEKSCEAFKNVCEAYDEELLAASSRERAINEKIENVISFLKAKSAPAFSIFAFVILSSIIFFLPIAAPFLAAGGFSLAFFTGSLLLIDVIAGILTLSGTRGLLQLASSVIKKRIEKIEQSFPQKLLVEHQPVTAPPEVAEQSQVMQKNPIPVPDSEKVLGGVLPEPKFVGVSEGSEKMFAPPPFIEATPERGKAAQVAITASEQSTVSTMVLDPLVASEIPVKRTRDLKEKNNSDSESTDENVVRSESNSSISEPTGSGTASGSGSGESSDDDVGDSGDKHTNQVETVEVVNSFTGVFRSAKNENEADLSTGILLQANDGGLQLHS